MAVVTTSQPTDILSILGSQPTTNFNATPNLVATPRINPITQQPLGTPNASPLAGGFIAPDGSFVPAEAIPGVTPNPAQPAYVQSTTGTPLPATPVPPTSTPEASTPDVYANAPSPASIASSKQPSNSSQGTQTAATSPGVQNASTPAGLTPQAFSALLNNALVPNPLNAYYQNTYHFRLFMCRDGDIIGQAGNPSSVAELMTKLSSKSIQQVTIAESGVTGYNIREVDIESRVAQNGATFSQYATTFKLTITEPLGVSFLDALFGAAAMLGVFNVAQMIYFLELTFTGYTEQGQPKHPIPFSGFPNGGCWIWAIVGTTIETKINEGGGVYTLAFTITESSVLCETKKLAGPQTLTIKGDTLGEIFDNYSKEMNDVWQKLYSVNGKTLRTFKIITHPISAGPYAGDDIRTYSTKSQTADQSSARLFSLDSTGKVQAQIPPGMSTDEFIQSAIKSTERGQKVIKDEPTLGNTSQTGTQVNDRKLRESTLFSIEIDQQQVDKEPQSGNYTWQYNVHVLSHYTQSPIVDATQVTNARDATVQQNAIAKLIKNGQLRKRYDYIFTGKNTEVIDFNIDFNMSWNYMLPKLAGARLGYNSEAVNARLGPIQKAQSDTKPQAATNLNISPQSIQSAIAARLASGDNPAGVTPPPGVDAGPSAVQTRLNSGDNPAGVTAFPANSTSTAQSAISSRLASGDSPAGVASPATSITGFPSQSAIAMRLASGDNPAGLVASLGNSVSQATQSALASTVGHIASEANFQGMLTGVTQANSSGVSPVQASQPRLSNTSGTTPSQASSNIYIEDVLNSVNQQSGTTPNATPNLPISFWQGYQTPEWLAGKGMTGQWGRDQSVVGAIFSQIYECGVTKGFQTINPLTIRGDPFWLGQSNLERQLKLRTNSGLVDPTAPPDNSTSKQIIYLYFKYPVQMGDDFKPVLSKSESFNGLYEITTVHHTFNDGVFKQELHGNLMVLHDIDAALSSSGGGGGGAGSSQQLAGAGGGGNSGSSGGGGVTTAQQQAFFDKYKDAAVAAGAATGISPNTILAQWAFESGYGTSRAAVQQNNLGGINIPGGNGEQYQSYATPQDFATAYTTLLQNRYPQALNTGTDTTAFAAGLKAGGYFTSPLSTYSAGVSSIAAKNPAGL